MANDRYCDDSYLQAQQAQQEQEQQEYELMIYEEEHKLEMANQQLRIEGKK